MKISKLFHWLYAILMLLPFAFFVPSVLYYAFNDNATMQSVEVPKTETVSVDFNQQITNGNFVDNQRWSLINANSGTGSLTFSDNFAHVQYASSYTYSGLSQVVAYEENCIYFAWCDVLQESGSNMSLSLGQPYTYRTISVSSGVLTRLEYRWTLSAIGSYSTFVIGNRASDSVIRQFSVTNVNLINLTQMFGRGNEPTISQFNEWFSNSYYPYTQSELMQITYEIGETQELIENTSIINYAWESIWDLPLFSWTKITFVSVPFSYLTGIFGIGASNSLNYVFGYFVTISIVWLVFDLLLYVPMLAHNWIDKARIE